MPVQLTVEERDDLLNSKTLLNQKEFAYILGICPETICQRIQRGEYKDLYVKVGASCKFVSDKVRDFLGLEKVNTIINNVSEKQVTESKTHTLKYYFTFGSDGYPYRGGWVTVEAENFKIVIDIFRMLYPDRGNGLLNCAEYYSEEAFKNTIMYANNDNLGNACHCEICLEVKTES